MDLLTLVTACALGADPKLMQALVWQQSGGNPWAISVPDEPSPRIYTSLQDAVHAAHNLSNTAKVVRVGLAGLPVPPARVTPAVFLPCWNVAIAAQQVAGLVRRCATHTQTTSIFCALSTYGGSWQKPNEKFATAVIKSLITKQVPDFDMPKDTSSSLLDMAIGTAPRFEGMISAADPLPAEREHAWVSGLFPLSQQHSGNDAKASSNAQSATANQRSVRKPNAPPAAPHVQANGPFLNGSKHQGQQ